MAALIRRLGGAVVLLAFSLHASAAFEARWSRFGDNTVIYDTSTELEWLRLDQTYGISYNDVWAQLDTTFAGFRIAANQEVSDLVNSVGIPFWEGAPPSSPQNLLDASFEFVSVFGGIPDLGFALSISGFRYRDGPFLYDEETGTYTGELSVNPMVVRWNPTRTYFHDDSFPFVKPYAYPTIGTFLVSTTPVPEPSTYALTLAGVGLLGFHFKRRSARAGYSRFQAHKGRDSQKAP